MKRKSRQESRYITVEFNPVASVASPLPPWAAKWHKQIAEAAAATLPTPRSKSKRKPKVPIPDPEHYRASELAHILNLSEDTVRRLFEDEPGVIVLGDRNPRGKRRRLTLRIPKSVFERVRKRLAN